MMILKTKIHPTNKNLQWVIRRGVGNWEVKPALSFIKITNVYKAKSVVPVPKEKRAKGNEPRKKMPAIASRTAELQTAFSVRDKAKSKLREKYRRIAEQQKEVDRAENFLQIAINKFWKDKSDEVEKK